MPRERRHHRRRRWSLSGFSQRAHDRADHLARSEGRAVDADIEIWLDSGEKVEEMFGRPFGIMLLAAALLAAGLAGIAALVELRVHRRWRPHLAAFSLRSDRLYPGDRITDVPVVVPLSRSRQPVSSFFVRGYLFFYFPRPPVSPQEI